MMPYDPSPPSTIGSSSSYAPVLINSLPSTTPTSPPKVPTKKPRRRPALRYAYPLIPLALLDAFHTLHQWHDSIIGLPNAITTLGVARATLLLAMGCTKRWRARGGWIGVGSGASLFLAVWEGCMVVMSRNVEGGGGDDKVDSELMLFLVIFGGIAILEYILFLLLLRLSPPPHRSNPLALRLPRAYTQEAMPFAFHSENVMATSSQAKRKMHGRQVSIVSRNTTGSKRSDWNADWDDGAEEEAGDIFQMGRGASEDESEYTSDDHEDVDSDAYREDEADEHDSSRDDEEADMDDVSSISSSSIIDLPPPLSPSALAIPPLSTGLSLASRIDSLERSPVIGPLVRRTRSARLLGRSWGSTRAELEEDQDDGRIAELGGNFNEVGTPQEFGAEGYGTFRR